ncbi:MAG: translation initiation factor IF-6 [Candidatus Diapherotrites archaeon]|uniref:Translation initiation factor IF-6 n=2 Tax=Candidatus Iainarchaeum sp. TaxID=3101447 RepID=A0A8T4L5L3_9ARCH|nr:translation initiation factor IF-6 [Candidatus Diapherotrites archaeon]
MEFLKSTVRGSPFVGVFAAVTDEIALFPHALDEKRTRQWEQVLGVKSIRCTIANSSLIGVFCKALGKKIVVPESVEATETRWLERNGLEVLVAKDYTALGNLLALNSQGGIVSPLVKAGTVKALEGFFGVPLKHMAVSGTEVVGSAATVTNKGFIVHPNIAPKEFEALKGIFRVYGTTGTANYGDPFVSNSLLANGHGVIVGEQTTGYELARIDEGLRGEPL